jgi:protein-S-isoprenylcysteine O-methyltransferase Ste14
MFTTFGVMAIQIAFRQFKLKSFLGFENEKSELRAEGILAVIRHPIAAGLGLITIGFFLFAPNAPSLISCLSIFIYLPIGIYLEEKKLISAYGEAYMRYKESVPAIIPRIPRGRN